MYREGRCQRAGPCLMTARRRAIAVLVPAVLGLTACAQPLVPVAEAEHYCSQNLSAPSAGLSAQPRLSVGIGTGGYRGAALGVDFTPERQYSRDPAVIFNDCVRQRSGQAPTKPLYQQPGWGG